MPMPEFLFELFYKNDMIYQTAKTANDFMHMAWDMLGASAIDTALGEISIHSAKKRLYVQEGSLSIAFYSMCTPLPLIFSTSDC